MHASGWLCTHALSICKLWSLWSRPKSLSIGKIISKYFRCGEVGQTGRRSFGRQRTTATGSTSSSRFPSTHPIREMIIGSSTKVGGAGSMKLLRVCKSKRWCRKSPLHDVGPFSTCVVNWYYYVKLVIEETCVLQACNLVKMPILGTWRHVIRSNYIRQCPISWEEGKIWANLWI